MKNIEENNKCEDCCYFRSEFNEFDYQTHNYCVNQHPNKDTMECFKERTFKDDIPELLENLFLIIVCLGIGLIIGLATR